MADYKASLLLDHFPGRPTEVALWEDQYWEIVHGDDSLSVTVIAGFIHDAASVPRYVRWVIGPMDGDIIRASSIHDWLYATHCFDQRGCTRREADREFRKAMLADESTLVRAWTAWICVRAFGWRRWWTSKGPRFAFPTVENQGIF